MTVGRTCSPVRHDCLSVSRVCVGRQFLPKITRSTLYAVWKNVRRWPRLTSTEYGHIVSDRRPSRTTGRFTGQYSRNGRNKTNVFGYGEPPDRIGNNAFLRGAKRNKFFRSTFMDTITFLIIYVSSAIIITFLIKEDYTRRFFRLSDVRGYLDVL